MSTITAEALREEVRKRYAEAALAAGEGSGCGCAPASSGCCGTEDEVKFGEGLYTAAERE